MINFAAIDFETANGKRTSALIRANWQKKLMA